MDQERSNTVGEDSTIEGMLDDRVVSAESVALDTEAGVFDSDVAPESQEAGAPETVNVDVSAAVASASQMEAAPDAEAETAPEAAVATESESADADTATESESADADTAPESESADADTAPESDVAPQPEPDMAPEAATEPEAGSEPEAAIGLEAGSASASDTAPEAEAETSSGRRRGRRRAASRPAGPPTPVFSAATDTDTPTTDIVIRPSVQSVAAIFVAPTIAPMPVSEPTSDSAADAEPAESASVTESEAVESANADAPEAAEDEGRGRRRRRRGGRGRGRRAEAEQVVPPTDEQADQSPAPEADSEASSKRDDGTQAAADATESEDEDDKSSSRRRRRRRRGKGGSDDAPTAAESAQDEVTAVKGSTRLEAKKQRRREGRANRGMRAPILTEAEFLARRESVDRRMVVRKHHGITQIAVLEDKVLVEHYVGSESNSSMIGNVFLGRVQNVLPSMEAAFVDVGRGRNAVLYAGEVNWDAAGIEGQPKRIELALKPGDTVLVQVTKDPIGHKGARLTSQISLPGRFLVYVPEGGMTGISRKLPDRERSRLKKILKAVVPDEAGVIVRTAAEGASEEQLRHDVQRLTSEWERIKEKAKTANAPTQLRSEPDLAIKVARDIFNEDFAAMTVTGEGAYDVVRDYIEAVAPDLADRVKPWTKANDAFSAYRIDEQLSKALDRKVWLPSGGSLVIDRTEAMTVIDVNTGKYTGQGGNLEETVTRNNLEAAEEIVRQLRLRDIGGIIVVDFIDMVLESNRDLVLRRLVECLSRDRTKHQVAEVTSLGLVQMTRKRIGQGLLETFSTPCEACQGRGVKISLEPVGHASADPRVHRAKRQRPMGPIPGAPIASRSHDVEHPEGTEGKVSDSETPAAPADPDADAAEGQTADIAVVHVEVDEVETSVEPEAIEGLGADDELDLEVTLLDDDDMVDPEADGVHAAEFDDPGPDPDQH